MKKQKRIPTTRANILNFLLQKWRYILSMLLIGLTTLLFFIRETKHDMLVYSVINHNEGQSSQSLMLYDPNIGKATTLLTDSNLINFSVSKDGRLAYSSSYEGNAEIYVRENLYPDSQSVNITQSPHTDDVTGAWSTDGRYLAYIAYQEDKNPQIFIWDGSKTIDITPSDVMDDVMSYSELSWSANGQMTFTLFYGSINPANSSEIYLWDGNKTTNLSQNTSGADRFAIWNSEGELAFLSYRDSGYDIFVWDGDSLRDGLPDITPFTNIVPEIITYYSSPQWTNESQLTFTGAEDSYIQIYVWDGNSAINVSQNPDHHNVNARWSTDGRWAFATTSGHYQESLYVRDKENNTILMTEGGYPAWSSNGDLIFCRYGWTLNLWNGQEIIEITQSIVINAQWQSGSRIHCSSG
jgi:Tol biopolymer transport system component